MCLVTYELMIFHYDIPAADGPHFVYLIGSSPASRSGLVKGPVALAGVF